MCQMCQEITQRTQEQDLKFSFHWKCTLNLRDPTRTHHPLFYPNFPSRFVVLATIALLLTWLAFIILNSTFPSPNSVSSSVSSKSYHFHLNPSVLFLSKLSSSLEEMIVESSSVCSLYGELAVYR